ncbi:ciliary microtubule inner protein 1 isoform X2 [Callithrix jacchus]|uniref:uncharacterized protein C20orf85 homolog isoform X2 n=1 Tax=Callithrix jacchus TaxID=9483 RepID=UPI00159E245B|nr:uncharacterized protein C20orf85 homolog isoform X2 [Callithrix jacchus]
MAQKPLSTAAAERMNLVAQDEIWRYRLKAESEARQNWPQNWGFLTTPFEELIKGEEELPTPKPKIELPERFHIWPVTPVEKYIKLDEDLEVSLCAPKGLAGQTALRAAPLLNNSACSWFKEALAPLAFIDDPPYM